MYCPQCSSENLNTSLRCLQCGASLITEVVGGSEEIRKHARRYDGRIYGGVGAAIGFVLALLVTQLLLEETWMDAGTRNGALVVSAVAGSWVGRYIARRRI